jgi:hypothetical protein
MRARVAVLVLTIAALVVPLTAGFAAPADAAPARPACKSPMKSGTWAGPVTQKFEVNGSASSGLTVTQQGTTAATLTLKVACNGKASGTITDSTFDLEGSSGIAGINFPVRCTGTTGEVPVTGTVTKGSGGKPVIAITYGTAASETFQCEPGPIGDILNAQFAARGTGTTTPGAPNGLSMPATAATKSVVKGTSFQATGGFDPIAISVQSLQAQGLTPTITQAWELTRS